jgi:hypothetical protein
MIATIRNSSAVKISWDAGRSASWTTRAKNSLRMVDMAKGTNTSNKNQRNSLGSFSQVDDAYKKRKDKTYMLSQ